jgi:hypothetical protein
VAAITIGLIIAISQFLPEELCTCAIDQPDGNSTSPDWLIR